MSVRMQWLHFSPSTGPFRVLVDQMRARQYTSRRGSGFRIDEVRRNSISGRFIERLEWEDTVEDPSGSSFRLQRVEFRQVKFRLFSSVHPGVELTNPPRALRTFVDEISKCCEKDIRLAEVVASPDAWLSELENHIGRALVASATAEFSLSARTSAVVDFTGSEDVREYIRNFAGDKSTRVSRIVVCLPSPYEGRVRLLTAGRAVILEGNDETVEILRIALRNACMVLS